MSFNRFSQIVMFGLLMLNSVFFTLAGLVFMASAIQLYGLMCWQAPAGIAVSILNGFAALIFVSHFVVALIPNTTLSYTSPKR